KCEDARPHCRYWAGYPFRHGRPCLGDSSTHPFEPASDLFCKRFGFGEAFLSLFVLDKDGPVQPKNLRFRHPPYRKQFSILTQKKTAFLIGGHCSLFVLRCLATALYATIGRCQ